MNLGERDPASYSPEEVQRLIMQREDAMRFLGILIERAGGEVRIGKGALERNRFLERDDDPFTGAVVLRCRSVP